MELTGAEVLQILDKAHALGVKHLKLNGIEADFAQKKEASEPDLKPFPIQQPEYTDEEVLFWSTPYYDELQAQKMARKDENG